MAIIKGMEPQNVIYVKSAREMREWFERNYQTAPEMWLVNPNKASGKPRVVYNDAVEVALCFGWIDSTQRKHDAESAVQRYTPRRRGSTYSQPNVERLRKLKAEGLLKPEVAEAVAPVLAAEFVWPADIMAAIRADELAWKNFQKFSDTYRRIRVAYVEGARKRSDEFKKRLANLVAQSAKNKMIGYGGIDSYF